MSNENFSKVYLSLGSNIGDRKRYLNKAISLLKANSYIFCVTESSLYITEPQGYKDQNDFVNCAVSLETKLTPYELLDICQKIEKKLKRVKLFRWGPRTIDIDILIFGNETLSDDRLTIPHPRMLERAFVLKPLSELTSDFNSYLKNTTDQRVLNFEE